MFGDDAAADADVEFEPTAAAAAAADVDAADAISNAASDVDEFC